VIYWLIRIWAALVDPSELFACDPVEGPRIYWNKTQREGARQLALEHMKARGAKPVFLAFLDSAGERETGWRPSRRHDENTGLGMHGMSERYFGARIENMCDPRQTAEELASIWRRAVKRYGARTPWDVHAVFAGRHECVTGVGECSGWMQDQTTRSICPYMQARGFDCYQPINLADAGRP